MKNASTLKSSKTDSPKTPGGISKSLLTPCRRIGLSRNFRKSGASPFQSPLSTKTEVKEEKVQTRKRKDSLEETPQTPENVAGGIPTEVDTTPTRNVELPRRKKSKTLLASISKACDDTEPTQENVNEVIKEKVPSSIPCDVNLGKNQNGTNKDVTTPLRTKSKSSSKKNIAISKISKSVSKEAISNLEKENLDNNSLSNNEAKTETSVQQPETEEKSPNNLTKECIVVIQKKIFKKELNEMKKSPKAKKTYEDRSSKINDTVSQAVFDSDSDDVPLICLNNKNTETNPNDLDKEDEDFASMKSKTNKLEKAHSKTKIKSPTSTKPNNPKVIPRQSNANINLKVANPSLNNLPNSCSSLDDDDDDFCETKRTILIRKSYDKVTKPQKAKSTGSITQKDIDNLKARIETKKKMLLARAMTNDTKDLRDLIKKWQKGCQDALMELMDLMKSKFPDKQNMDYSEILQTLKIPASLVGYDSDNDCFLTPEDESIILARV